MLDFPVKSHLYRSLFLRPPRTPTFALDMRGKAIEVVVPVTCAERIAGY
jgi:hypothetical protein